MNIVDDADGPLDPRIQIELENLNNATDDINKLEIELDEANTVYIRLLSETKNGLKELVNKLGSSCIEKAKCYLEARQVADQARLKCDQQALLYRRANEVHAAAKETVAHAEARFMSHQHEWNFDQAWQDVLNHTTLKVMEAETQKAECDREHHKATLLFHEADKKAQQLKDKYQRSINKAEPYFELKSQCDQKLNMQKEVVDCLKKAIKDAKCSYATSLRALEEISNQIHEKRRDYDILANGPREPGVGAELVTPDESLNYEDELNKLKLSRVNSVASSEQDLEERIQDFEDVKNLKERVDHLSARSVDGSESIFNQWELELQASVDKLNNLPCKSYDSDKPDSVNSSNVRSNEVAKYTGNNSNIVTDAKILKNNENERPNKLDDIYQGWQSLTQSPLNSIISRSKIALKNSISKSLSNSSINIGSFSFGKSKSLETHAIPDQSINSIQDQSSKSEKEAYINRVDKSPTVNEQLEASCSKNSKSEDTCTKPDKNGDFQESAESPVKPSKLLLDYTHNENMPKVTHSLNSTPVRVKPLSSSKSTNFLSNKSEVENARNNIKSNYSSSKVRELPLLSFFQKSANLIPSKDKSCSMIDLNEKQNLKALLDKSELGNIQAVSIEKLANARHKLIGES